MSATSRLVVLALAAAAAHAASWREVARVPDAGVEARVIALRDGSVLRVTASGPSALFLPASLTWVRVPGLRHPRGGFRLARLADGRVLAVGGTDPADDERALATAEVFDPATRAWRDTGALLTPRRGAVAVTLDDGRVLVAGGVGRTASVDDPATPYDDTQYPGGWLLGRLPLAELYDPRTGRWSATASMRYAHASGEGIGLGGDRALVYGGWSDAGDSTFQQPISEVYDAKTARWTTTVNDAYDADFTTQPLTPLPDGRVVVLEARLPYADVRAGARVFDPRTLRWADFPAAAPSGASATLLDDGSLLASGGNVVDGDGFPVATNATELLPRGSAAWRATAAMRRARVGHDLIRLPGDRALAIGGDAAGTCEVYQGDAQTERSPIVALFRIPTAID